MKPLTISLILFLLVSSATPGYFVASSSQKALPPGSAKNNPNKVNFPALIAQLSEEGGYFDTDNIISNESSYLHVVGKLQELGIKGGVYLGVGPDQNFSYIAKVRPRMAFILDIRRQNLIQHLLFKALFHLADDRAEYLSLLLSKPLGERKRLRSATVEKLIGYFDQLQPGEAPYKSNLARITDLIQSEFRVPMKEDEIKLIGYIYRQFFDHQLDIRYSSYGRAPQRHYPTYRQLLLEKDLSGRYQNYLAWEDDFQFLKQLQHQNLIIPVVGDFAGQHALKAIGQYIRSIGERVSVFYTSNVEFYLMQNRSFSRFADNVLALPISSRSILIRSYFGYRFPHPQAVPGYYSTSLLQKMTSFVDLYKAGQYDSYQSVVLLDYIELR